MSRMVFLNVNAICAECGRKGAWGALEEDFLCQECMDKLEAKDSSQQVEDSNQ